MSVRTNHSARNAQRQQQHEYLAEPSYMHSSPVASLGVCRNGALGFTGDDYYLPLSVSTGAPSVTPVVPMTAAQSPDGGSVGSNRDALRLMEQQIQRSNRFASRSVPTVGAEGVSRARSVDRKGAGRGSRAARGLSCGPSVNATAAGYLPADGQVLCQACTRDAACLSAPLARPSSVDPALQVALEACFVDKEALPKIKATPLSALSPEKIFNMNKAIYECMNQQKLPVDHQGRPQVKLFNFFGPDVLKGPRVSLGLQNQYKKLRGFVERETSMGPLHKLISNHYLQSFIKSMKDIDDPGEREWLDSLEEIVEERIQRLQYECEKVHARAEKMREEGKEEEALLFEANRGFVDKYGQEQESLINVHTIAKLVGKFDGGVKLSEAWNDSYKWFKHDLIRHMELDHGLAEEIKLHAKKLWEHNNTLPPRAPRDGATDEAIKKKKTKKPENEMGPEMTDHKAKNPKIKKKVAYKDTILEKGLETLIKWVEHINNKRPSTVPHSVSYNRDRASQESLEHKLWNVEKDQPNTSHADRLQDKENNHLLHPRNSSLHNYKSEIIHAYHNTGKTAHAASQFRA